MKRARWPVAAGIATMLVLGYPAAFGAQTNNGTSTVETIDHGGDLPYVLDELEKRLGVPITYESPLYVCPEDIHQITLRTTPPRKVWVVSDRTIHFQYATVNGKPKEDTTSLIRRLLREYADDGGAVFDVRERMLPGGPEWNVIPLKARDQSGKFVDQIDILGSLVFIPKAQRSGEHFLEEIYQQLKTRYGYHLAVATIQAKLAGERILGAENVPARDALAELLGRDFVWFLGYDPEPGRYVLSILEAPQSSRPSPAVAAPVAPPSTAHPPGPSHVPIPSVMRWSKMPGGIRHIQSLLAQAGYYTGEPTGKWDENTIEAVKKGQAANNLPVTGELDSDTIRKLGLDVIAPPPR